MFLNRAAGLVLVGLLVFMSDATVASVHQTAHAHNKSVNTKEAVTRFRRSYEGRLYKDLFERYNKNIRPCADVKCTTPTKLEYAMAFINAELHMAEKRLNLHSWLRLIWDDARLSWNPEDYGDLHSVQVPQQAIWKPDMVLYTKDQLQGNRDKEWMESRNAILFYTGTVMLVPESHLRIPCLFNKSSSHQECLVKFGSWTYSGYQLDLAHYGDEHECDLQDFEYVINDDWEMFSCSAQRNVVFYQGFVEPYPDITYHITFKKYQGF